MPSKQTETMYITRTDEDRGGLFLKLAGEPTADELDAAATDLRAGAEALEDSFTLLTDLTECRGLESGAGTAAGELLASLDGAGLSTEIRLIGSETGDVVVEAFNDATVGLEYRVERYPTLRDAPGSAPGPAAPTAD